MPSGIHGADQLETNRFWLDLPTQARDVWPDDDLSLLCARLIAQRPAQFLARDHDAGALHQIRRQRNLTRR